MIIFICVGVAFIVSLIVSILRHRSSHRKKDDSGFIYFEDYLNDWVIDKKTKQGYYYKHSAGCYVILIFDKFVKNGRYDKYRDVYVGQSIWVENRVHNHFIGKGNGDVYADVKYGKKVYVKIIYCDREEMNAIERQLIEKYDATNSYNGTLGGSTDWLRKKY